MEIKTFIDMFKSQREVILDFNNAHVGRGGMYHYHGLPTSLVNNLNKSHIGYAGDGFEIHYIKGKMSA